MTSWAGPDAGSGSSPSATTTGAGSMSAAFACADRARRALRPRPAKLTVRRPPSGGRLLSVMYAIVKVGGKQYRVEKGDSLVVDRMREDEGATVSLEPLLFSGDKKDDAVFSPGDLGKIKVEAKVVGHERGKKIRVVKFKPKRGYKRTAGHRSELTRLEITTLEAK